MIARLLARIIHAVVVEYHTLYGDEPDSGWPSSPDPFVSQTGGQYELADQYGDVFAIGFQSQK